MAEDLPRGGSGTRVARHRIRRSASGLRRVEVTVPVADAALVRTVAATLRHGGDEARELRDARIAAVARRYGLTLATRNIGDFTGMSVPLVDPWAPR